MSRWVSEPPVRPRASILMAILLGCAGLLGLVVVGAWRAQEPIAAWIGIGLALLLLPVVDFYRRTVWIEPDGLVATRFGVRTRIAYQDVEAFGYRTSWAARSGQWSWLTVLGLGGERIDVSVTTCGAEDVDRLVEVLELRAPRARRVRPAGPGRTPGLALVTTAAGLLVALSLLVLGIALSRTLGGERLFGDAALVGTLLGLGLGALLGRRVVPTLPVAAVTAAALALMTAVPAGALLLNARTGALPPHDVPVEVLVRRSSRDKAGTVARDVDLDVGGTRERLRPDSALFDSLSTADRFSACVRPGGLGFPVLASLTRPCERSSASSGEAPRLR
jgi:hypothetical protein